MTPALHGVAPERIIRIQYHAFRLIMRPRTRSLWQEGGFRLILVGLLLLAYFFGWRSARNDLMGAVVYPALATLSSGSDAALVQRRGGSVAVHVPEASSAVLPSVLAPPAGTKFLLPAIAVLLLAPRKPYWLMLWGGHLIILAATVATLALALSSLRHGGDPSDIPVAFYIADFLQGYVLDVFSLAVPVLALAREGFPPDVVSTPAAS